tara:strand:- start:6482 stop:6901 length:420 start_codon:yes stop_codon:yes gene_type:complete
MATQKGKGIVFGITSTGFAFAGASALGIEPTGETLRHEAEIVKFKDKQGEDVGAVVFNQSKRLTLNAYPTGSDTSGAGTANNLPNPGDRCQLTDGTDAEIGGEWMVESCEKAKTNGEITTFTIELANSATSANRYHLDA